MSDLATFRTWQHIAATAATLLLLATTIGCDDEPSQTPEDVVEDPADGGSDTSPDQMDTEEEVAPRVETEGSVRFDLAAALEDDFFAFPYPSDLRLNEAGAPDLSSFPTWYAVSNMLEQAAKSVETSYPGFSPLSAVYIGFSVSLDTDTLPADVPSTLEPSSSVYLIDITSDSPSYGQRQPVTVSYNDTGGGYWSPRTLTIHPLYGLPLRTNTTYAAVVTSDVLDVDGDPLEAPSILADLGELLESERPAPALAEAYRPLYEALVDLDESPELIVAATVFTTSDPAAELRVLRDWMETELDPPHASDIALSEDRSGFTVYDGTFDSVEFFTGLEPYRNFGEGEFTFEDDGQPTAQTAIDLAFAISVPDGAAPEEGWPVVLYGHGLGENSRGFVRVAAPDMAARGVAVLGISPPLQGERNPTGLADQDLIVNLAITNIVAGREILRQGVCDEIRAGQLVQAGLTIPAEVSESGVEITFDPDRVAFIGHSEGAQIGALLAAIDSSFGATVLSAGGGGAAITLLELNVSGMDVAQMVALAVGIDESVETFDLDHPVITVIIQPLLDCADPLHVARQLFLEPESGRGHDVVMMSGFGDLLTPPASTEALVSAAGLPIAEPVGRAIEGLDLQGIGNVALPAGQNLPEVDGYRPTGALLQFPDDDHYIIYRNTGARHQIFEFVKTALAGSAEIPPAPQ